ncbi:MAG: Fe-S cluster assembly protein SufD [Acidobacteriota bacterium]
MSSATLPDKAAGLAAYEELFSASERTGESEGVSDLRRSALDRFLKQGFPTRRDEEWRQTNVAPIAKSQFARGTGGSVTPSAELYDGCDHMVFVDGRLEIGLSAVPEGVDIRPLSEALVEGLPLGDLVPEEGHPFAAMNTALFEDGLYVHVSEKAQMVRPLQVHFESTGQTTQGVSAVSFPRNLIVVERGGEGRVIETYSGAQGRAYMTNAVTEMHLGENATLRHVKVMQEGDASYHMALQSIRLERSANLHSIAVNQGGSLVRNDLRSLLDGEDIDCVLNGLVLGNEQRIVDNHLWMEHAKPNCYSHQLYKGVLADRSRAVFTGRIFVHQEAQKTDAVQTNRNLLLSEAAIANSNPQLEIFADDVKCTHGSTIGQLEDDAHFYLRSRGVDADVAKGLLVYAFASEILQEIDLEPLRDSLERILVHELASGV